MGNSAFDPISQLERCTVENLHDTFKASIATFLAETVYIGLVDAGDEVLLLGNCKRCLSTLGYSIVGTGWVRE